MRILFIEFFLPYLLKDNNYPAGGWTNELLFWLKGLDDYGCKVGVLSWKGAKSYVGKDTFFELIDTYEPKKGIRFLRYFYRYIPPLLKKSREFRPDVIIQSGSGIDTGIMAYIARKIDVPFIYRVASDRDADKRIYKVENARLPFYAKLAYWYGLRNTTATLCQNQYQYDQLKTRYPQKQHYILYNPFKPITKLPELCAREKKKYIAWVGIFKYEKNMPLLYRIARQLPDIQFKIAGMKSPHIDEDTKVALKKLEKLDNIIFAGFIKRKGILTFLNEAIALLATSHYEGFSNVFLEAMATGTPVVTPRRIDPDKIITNNRLGLTTEKDDELPDLVQQIITMNSDEYTDMADRCPQYVHEHHDPVVKAKELTELIENIQQPTHA